RFGGTCVNTGCIPTKTLVASARAAHIARRASEYGVMIDSSITVDMKKVKESKDAVVRRSNEGVEKWLKSTANLTVATVGSFLVILMSLTTLFFLVTTPEAWVSGPGNTVHGFPFLALPGLLVVKDSMMLGAAILTMADSAKTYLRRIGEAN